MQQHPYRQPTSMPKVEVVGPEMTIVVPVASGRGESSSRGGDRHASRGLRAGEPAGRENSWSYYVFRRGLRMLLDGQTAPAALDRPSR
jgi:hypothetical protein